MTRRGTGRLPRRLARGRGAPASDVELALLLVNSQDLLEDPPDRLGDLGWLTHVFDARRARRPRGRADHARSPAAAAPPRRAAQGVRERRRRRGRRGAQPAAAEGSCRSLDRRRPSRRDPLASRARAQGLAALEARLPAAVAAFVAEHGVRRLGVCGSDPCRCVFVDRTRAGTRKYCCTYCNDRFAARAYRRRKPPPPPAPTAPPPPPRCSRSRRGQSGQQLRAVGRGHRPRQGHGTQCLPVLSRVGPRRAGRGQVLRGGARPLRSHRRPLRSSSISPRGRDAQPLHRPSLVRTHEERLAQRRGARAVRALLRQRGHRTLRATRWGTRSP